MSERPPYPSVLRHCLVVTLSVGLYLSSTLSGLVQAQVQTEAASSPDVQALIDDVGPQLMPIDRLVVAPAGAWVTRTLSVAVLADLSTGKTGQAARTRLDPDEEGGGRLWVQGLPADLHSDSLRVTGVRVDAEAGVRVEREVADETVHYQRLRARLEAAQADVRAVGVRLEENSLRREIARDQLAGLVAGEADLNKLWQADGPVTELMDRISRDREALLERQATIRGDIRALRSALDEMASRAPGWRVGVAVNADPGDFEPDQTAIELAYRVENAGWEPIHQARLDTTTRRVDWQMSARIHQQSGEDWPAVSTTLVTSDRRRFYPVPALDPLTIGFIDPEREHPVRPKGRGQVMLAERASAADAGAARVEDRTGFATEIAINRPTPIPSGEGGVNIAVLAQQLDASVELRLAPQSSTDAVVVAEFEPSIVHALPAGRWEVYRDGQQQAGASWSALRPDEPVELSFGVDPRLVVDYRQPPDERAAHGVIGKFRQIERRRQLTVTSRHEQPIAITMLMRLPIAIDADIVVEPLAKTTKPAERGYQGQKGVWAYRQQLAPDQPWEIDFAYRVRWPEDKRISPF